jgi:DNA (cytosine-5)-methyltransferase 1
MLTHGSLFSGVGGFELGAKMSGIDTLWNCEIEPDNREILKKHFPNSKQYIDITQDNDFEYVDIVSGGFPCQDISIANTKKYGKPKGIKGERSGLWSEMFKVCRQIGPQYIVIENSPMLLIRGFEQVLCDLSEIGYMCEWRCLRASQFGYNHKRERLFAIAYPEQMRCLIGNNEIFKEFSEILLKQTSRQTPISMPIKRFNKHSDYSDVRMDDGFSKGLDRKRIAMMGNAVVPEIAHYLFQCIKKHNLIFHTSK